MRERARAGAVLAAAALGLACRAEGERPGFVVMPEMHASVPYDTYERNPVLGTGHTLALPPEGTVPMGVSPFAYGPGPEEARRAGAELRNPVTPTEEALARGKKVFDTICFVCHGTKGEGDGPVIGRFPNPPSLLAERARKLPDGQIFHIITIGQGLMPPHAVQVLPEDRWRVILYVRGLQSGGRSPATLEAGGPVR